ncbi:hypothetical protein BRYFOR_06973 [Marvinbryantia formatexigens DSM 14469]|uniref:DUF4340 domain-containing protein n=1 Tax=Marvinbryantia formatexigens DSM 14469 TaxID=478749 RepID=C6LEC4_9FIRM|nr:DUF4340 domain-containing protein [Marvinbryantia formatexigens]EET60907.1 hypothetical protein BRYFOR_06973 [Marvinbryantia formatexigens DSM 14469]UWO24794.1 DUF4340 domain-containing protein [Marvinbryantia formatexigens DSM 14469]SDF23625.1 protein of unknown function [Marvinbryantia formatexigens]
MKRKTITMSVTVLALAALVGGYMALKEHNEQAEEEEALQAEGEVIWETDTDSLTAISFFIGDDQYTFEKESGSWQLAGDETFPVDEEVLEELFAAVTPLKALRTLTDVEDTAEYGMEDPQNVITLDMEDGTEQVLTIGDNNESTGNDYLMLADSDTTVYTVSSDVRTAIYDGLYDYAVSEELPPITQDNITGITFNSEDTSYMIYKEEDTWMAEGDGVKDSANTDITSELVAQISGVYYVDYLEHDCEGEDLAQYGLEEPFATLTITYEEDDSAKSKTIKIGSTDSEGNYYTQLSGSTQVHTIAPGMVEPFLEYTAEKIVQTETDAESETAEDASEAETEAESKTAEDASEAETETESEAADDDSEEKSEAESEAADVGETDDETADAGETENETDE